ncbi:MAG: hypothetical protein R3F59_21665 [Myxococcota bacterium]
MMSRLLAVAVAVLSAADARAQSACVTEANSDFINFDYTPPRPFSLENGRLDVLASDIVADDEHDFSSASRFTIAPATAGALTATATYNVIDARAHVETYLFGYGEAGIDVTMTARNSAGTVLCTDHDELYIARYNETGTPAPGVRPPMTCPLPAGTTSATIEVTAQAWVTIGGAAAADSRLTLQIVNVGIQSCTASCGGHCGGSASSSAGTCFCDAVCSAFGDCCADAAPQCLPGSCWEQCGGAAPGGSCFCDGLCTGFGDCCSDFTASCG